VEIFGLSIERRQKAGDMITSVPPTVILGPARGWWPVIRESFAGAWQRSATVPLQDAATHPTFWSCLTLIASDIAKLRPKLIQEDQKTGICTEVTNTAFSPVLAKPNHYQNRIQFYTYWLLSKLSRGNAYALKQRNHRGGPNRGNVEALYVLDPMRVQPMVAPNGDVFYALQQDQLSQITEASVIVPASEIIHDLMFPLYHPLVGLSPIYACASSVMHGQKVIQNMTNLFANGSMLGGILTTAKTISEAAATRIQKHWEENYSGEANAGRVAVLGDDLKFDKPPVMSAVDAQLIEQLKWDDEKICATFHVPPYMVGVGAMPTYNNIEALNQQYYSQCLQVLIESLELCLNEGLELSGGLGVEMDLEGLLRMDSAAAMKFATDGVKGMVFTPNEARARFNKKPLKGGDTAYGQEQDHSLEWLSKRDAEPIAPKPSPAAMPPQLPSEGKALKSLCATCGDSGLLPESAMGDPVGQIPCPDCQIGAAMMRTVGDQVDDLEGESGELFAAALEVTK
jgi:HK97 family phage portal protein